MQAGKSVVALIAIGAVTGCGSGGGSTASTTVPGVAFEVANTIKGGLPRATVERRLGPPTLTSHRTTASPRPCGYWAMKGHPLSDDWQFCFNGRERVYQGVTQYTVDEPLPPEGASPARGVLIARGDTICREERIDLIPTLRRLHRGLPEATMAPTRAARGTVVDLISRFNAVLVRTESALRAFDAPVDQRSTLEGYLRALRAQTMVLARARAALAASQDTHYEALVGRFDALGKMAQSRAAEYGFSKCAGATFS